MKSSSKSQWHFFHRNRKKKSQNSYGSTKKLQIAILRKKEQFYRNLNSIFQIRLQFTKTA
jgi:hypothetical protein